ncbi:MAG: MFS transporter [Haloquadratum sp.]
MRDRETEGDGADAADRWLYGWALGYAAIGAASLFVPLYAIDLGAGAFLVSLIAATAAFAGVPGAILWGRLVTRTRRRRPFLLVALGLAAAVFFSLPFLSSPWTVLVANAALWFVVAAATPVLNVIVVEGYPTEQWTERFGLLNHYQGYGWLAGLVGGGAWSALVGGPRVGLAPLAAKRLFFVVSGVVTLGAVLFVLRQYPEPQTMSDQRFRRLFHRVRSANGHTAGAARAAPYGPMRLFLAAQGLRFDRESVARLRERFSARLVEYLFAAAVFFAGFSAFFGPLPAYLVEAGYAADAVFALFVVNAAASAAAYAPAGSLAAEYDPFSLQAAALAFRTGAFPVVAVAGSAIAPPVGLVVVGLFFFAIGASWAVIAVTATGLVTELAPEPVRAEALGAYTAIGSLGGGIGSVLGGAVADAAGYLPAFGLAGGCVAVALLLAFDGLRGSSAAFTGTRRE